MGVVIYHNPRCTKSRETLALIQDKCDEITIVEYLNKKIGFFELKNILRFLDKKPDEIIRKNEQVYKDLGIADKNLTDLELIKIMVQYPILIERPIVVHDEKAVIGRPPENVLSIL